MSSAPVNILKVNLRHRHRRTMSTQVLKEIFLKSVEAVQPCNLIPRRVSVSDGHLSVNSRTFPIRKPCYMVGFGKAVLGMALELEKILEDKLQMGIVNVSEGISRKFEARSSKIRFIEGAADNVPDEAALAGAQQIAELARRLGKDDLLLVLISGGGSALLPSPVPPMTLRDKQRLVRELSARGADIVELNRVRKRLSLLKGGGLAELAHPATVVALILSDVVGDPLDVIASGPTTPNLHRPEDALEVVRRYNCYEGLPPAVKSVLEGRIREKKRFSGITDGKYDHVENFVIGNNRLAAEAARQCASSLGFQAAVVSTSVSGDVKRVSRVYADLALALCNPSRERIVEDVLVALRDLDGGKNYSAEVNSDLRRALINLDLDGDVCFIAAGEPTVVVSGRGRGGRNQQLALELSVRLNKLNIKSADISFLSCGTDGIDGPTDAAGAIGTSDLVNNGLAQNIKPEDYLNNNDAYEFYSRYRGGEYLIKIGHTGTNVMDVHVMVVKPKKV